MSWKNCPGGQETQIEDFEEGSTKGCEWKAEPLAATWIWKVGVSDGRFCIGLEQNDDTLLFRFEMCSGGGSWG